MKISYNWLQQFIKTDWPAEDIGKLLTDLGLEVEGIETFESVKGGLNGIVVGEILECIPHPNADRLKITRVDVGGAQNLQIVCGAPNVAKGQKVPVALIGTTLYDKNGAAFKINKGKIRGEESHGMICAEDELGLGKSHEGIMVLDNKAKPGKLLKEVFKVETDYVFEIGLTPNRADAMSHWGVARDLKAGLVQRKETVHLVTPSIGNFHIGNRSNKISIEVQNSEMAPRYCGLSISGLKIKASPEWLQNRLKAIGIVPKNNVVDATNYVMHELGQPLHAFDAEKISGRKIRVKTLPKGTKFTTLDGVERTLDENDLMICDSEKPLCIAGILGGLNSGISETTSAIFLESAYFYPVAIRKTAKRHGLNTDASFRFERGVDPNITGYALKRAALLIQEIAGGDVSSDLDDFYPKKIDDFQVFLTYDKINKLIGQKLDENTIKSILTSLEIRVLNVTESGMGLDIPAYRVDVYREIDVIEEILRVYGYNNVGIQKKLNASIANSSKFDDYKIQNIIGNQLVGQGFYEMMANSLTTESYLSLNENLLKENSIVLLNPLSQDLAVMRQSLLFSGLEAIAHNLNRQNEDLKFFEFGKTYHKTETGTNEKKHLSILISGNRNAESWKTPSEKVDFFYMKACLTAVLRRLGITGLSYMPAESGLFAEGTQICFQKHKMAEFGRVKKKITNYFDIEKEVLFADLDWDMILQLVAKQKQKYVPVEKFPRIRRDFALLVDKKVSFAEIEEIARQNEKKLLKEINLFDVYEGENLPPGKKSYAVSFVFSDESKTLTDKQIEKIMGKLQREFEGKLKATLR